MKLSSRRRGRLGGSEQWVVTQQRPRHVDSAGVDPCPDPGPLPAQARLLELGDLPLARGTPRRHLRKQRPKRASQSAEPPRASVINHIRPSRAAQQLTESVMVDFTGKTVLITGASGALGTTLSVQFAQAGANVVAASRSRYHEVAEKAGGNSVGVRLDVTSETEWTDAIARTEERFGPLDILINNAAYLRIGTTESIPLDEFRRVIDTNLTGALLGIRAAAPSMRKAGGGAIVNVNSIAGLTAAPELVAYSSSKWALRGLMRAAAKGLARDNIRVNSVHPGIIETPLAYDPDGKPIVPVDNLAVPRNAAPEEIADFILFAASDQARFATGSEILADGGYLLGAIA
ncbi:SDR family oxidoreductase [Amycolatopsis sp. RM579]|uniref:SDR family oxidoreductase n=2 Tax=Amycolatopsis pithecellobii TaxID=664692 RepID=A0A6N7YZE9_9PSEU|nr:SDR family oxidoreductase [Amycolatopsis pithecellobii]